jgi:2-oxoisovalerate dehydrogenase E2 component (dihydrolipoyl transacylase)
MKIFNLPDLGEGLAEAEIVRWHVKPGDRISADDPMLAVETAKAIVEVPAPFSGVIKTLHGAPGDTVATGGLLVEFEPDTRMADAATVVGSMPIDNDDFVFGQGRNSAISANTTNADRVRAIPAARALAKRLAIDIMHVDGTGRGGLVTVDDVLRTVPSDIPGSLPPPSIPAAAFTAVPHRNTDGSQHDAAAVSGAGERLRGPRRSMAQSMATSRDNVTGCTLFDDADLHGWQLEQDITSRILRAIAEGCSAEPGLNAWFDGEALTRQVLSHIDVAIAVDTPEGLIVPVIRNIRGRPVAELRRDVDRLKRDARERTVRPEDLRNFTFMLSNFGMIAGRYATPVVVPPAVAILGCGRLSHDVIATQNRIEAHPRMPLSLTFDHRCVTGGEAARFLAAVIRDLQKGN